MTINELIIKLKKFKNKDQQVLVQTSIFEYHKIYNVSQDFLSKVTEEEGLKIGDNCILISLGDKFKL